eukprot:9345754-Karenia_brevis.AAC.1
MWLWCRGHPVGWAHQPADLGQASENLFTKGSISGCCKVAIAALASLVASYASLTLTSDMAFR